MNVQDASTECHAHDESTTGLKESASTQTSIPNQNGHALVAHVNHHAHAVTTITQNSQVNVDGDRSPFDPSNLNDAERTHVKHDNERPTIQTQISLDQHSILKPLLLRAGMPSPMRNLSTTTPHPRRLQGPRKLEERPPPHQEQHHHHADKHGTLNLEVHNHASLTERSEQVRQIGLPSTSPNHYAYYETVNSLNNDVNYESYTSAGGTARAPQWNACLAQLASHRKSSP
jgi:hypothetical protein